MRYHSQALVSLATNMQMRDVDINWNCTQYSIMILKVTKDIWLWVELDFKLYAQKCP